jgi:NAD(P)-dependent dehydrogenase (short-subunit alcohol dehydrogenase family)
MTTPQQSVGSPFGARSTAAEIVKDADLSGKLAIVTGGHSGIGLPTVCALAAAGAEVIVPARDIDRAREAVIPACGEVKVAAMDLSDLASVRKFASDVRSQHRSLHFLINNAGIMACPETRVGPGWELQFATNHIGHFVLTQELAPLLKAAGGARVVSLSSSGHKRSDIRWEDIHFRKEPYEKWTAYGQSKTANALFARGLDARMKSHGVRAFSVHPGGIMTPLQRHLRKEEMVALGWIDEHGEIAERARAAFKSPEQGAATTIFAALSPLLDGKGGVYCEDCDVSVPWTKEMPHWRGVMPWIMSDEGADRLWRETEKVLA